MAAGDSRAGAQRGGGRTRGRGHGPHRLDPAARPPPPPPPPRDATGRSSGQARDRSHSRVGVGLTRPFSDCRASPGIGWATPASRGAPGQPARRGGRSRPVVGRWRVRREAPRVHTAPTGRARRRAGPGANPRAGGRASGAARSPGRAPTARAALRPWRPPRGPPGSALHRGPPLRLEPPAPATPRRAAPPRHRSGGLGEGATRSRTCTGCPPTSTACWVRMPGTAGAVAARRARSPTGSRSRAVASAWTASARRPSPSSSAQRCSSPRAGSLLVTRHRSRMVVPSRSATRPPA